MAEARQRRDKNVDCFERSFLILCIMMLVFGFSMLVSGAYFISNELWYQGQFGLDQVKVMAGVLIIAYALLAFIFAAIGVVISCKRDCSVAWVAIYGVLVFFAVSVPLLVEGTALTKLGQISNDEIQTYCDRELIDIHNEHSRMVFAFFDFAHRFDKMSAQMLDKYMCTDKCPCLDYGEEGSSKATYSSSKV